MTVCCGVFRTLLRVIETTYCESYTNFVVHRRGKQIDIVYCAVAVGVVVVGVVVVVVMVVLGVVVVVVVVE